MTTGHPSPAQLALRHETFAPSWLEDHLTACARCRRIARSERSPWPEITLPAHAVPAGLHQLLAAPLPEESEPAPFDLWRVEWDGHAEVGVVTDVDEHTVTLLAVELAPPEAEPASARYGAAATVLGCPFEVWPFDSVAIPRFALDRRLAQLDRIPLDHAARNSKPLVTPDRLASLQRLAERVRQAVQHPGGLRLLSQTLKAAGATRADLISAGLAPAAASHVLQGRRTPTPEEVPAVAELLGVDPIRLEAILSPVVGELLTELHRPARRRQVWRRALAWQQPEPEVRRHIAREIEAAPRRSPRGEQQIDWAAAVDDYFADDDA